jgi:hypothetical protein
MKPKTLVILSAIAAFAAAMAYALLRELEREQGSLIQSISGTVEVKPELFAQGVADIVKTDRLALILVDPATGRPVALRFESPLVPPQTIRIGQVDARDGNLLAGAYLLVGITDKDGEVFKVTSGEVYGRLAEPVKLGTAQVRLVLDQPFRGSLMNEPSGASPRPGPAMSSDPPDPGRTISGTVHAAPDLALNVAPEDHLIIMLFDPEAARPAAIKVIPHAILPQAFSISLPPGVLAKAGYSLRIITDKDGSPFNAASGELAGRSAVLIPLGARDVIFVLDQPYER